MFTRKINYIWAVNLILFGAVVFLGIEQAGRGAEISNLENKIEEAVITKRELAEGVFNGSSEIKLSESSLGLGFSKPTNIHYFKTEEVFAQR